jgi:hypothetical protein
MKQVLLLFLIVSLSGCSMLGPRTSICDDLQEPSRLCQVANKAGVRLEDIGNILIVTNAVAIGEGAYEAEDACRVLEDIRTALDVSITYLFVRNMVMDATSKYPGLFIVAGSYLDLFDLKEIITDKDKQILKGWLDKQIVILGCQK